MKTFLILIALSFILQEIKSNISKNLILTSMDKIGVASKPLHKTQSEFMRLIPSTPSSDLIQPAMIKHAQWTKNCMMPQNKHLKADLSDKAPKNLRSMRQSNTYDSNLLMLPHYRHSLPNHDHFSVSKNSLEAFGIGVTTGVGIISLVVAVTLKFFLLPFMIVRLVSLFLIQQRPVPAPLPRIRKLDSPTTFQKLGLEQNRVDDIVKQIEDLNHLKIKS